MGCGFGVDTEIRRSIQTAYIDVLRWRYKSMSLRYLTNM